MQRKLALHQMGKFYINLLQLNLILEGYLFEKFFYH